MLRRLFSIGFLLVLVAACTQAPQPYRHGRTGVDTSGLRLRDGGTVYIMPIEGTARPIGKMIATGLAESLGVRNIPSTPNELSNPTYKVRGQFILDFNSGRENHLGSVYWTFMDRTGKMIHESIQEIQGQRHQWDYGDQVMIDGLVDTAADKFTTYLQDASEYKAVELAENEKPVIFMVGNINGARGDGEKALRKAMSLTLRQFGAKVRSRADKDTYILNADIDILKPFEGKQRIQISWIIKDKKGNELGRARQNNQMPEGAFDGKWGGLAYNISRAAMNGIGQVVERDRLEKKFEASRQNPATTAAPGRKKGRAPAPF